MIRKKIVSAFLSITTLIAAIPFGLSNYSMDLTAAESYPIQKFLMGISDTDRSVNASGSTLKSDVQNGSTAEKWSLNYISDGVYEIVSSSSGNILTVNGSNVNLSKDTDGASQRWKIEGVQKDFDGYYLYYKIVSNADSSKALTFNSNSNSFSLSSYSGKDNQKFKLNLDGIEGFAGNTMCKEGEKAGAIGGLLGKTVTASTADQLESYLNEVGAMTIVINGNIDMQKKGNTRIRDNKTIVGSYSANTIQDCQFRTNDAYGATNDSPSDNIVFRNIDFQAVNVKNRILINIWSSRNIWIDHCTFNNRLSYDKTGNGQDEVGKFIWINTPYESYLDAKDRLRSPDYITISYCSFTNRYWTVAYGTQNDETSRCRTTLCYNKWDKNVRRCPQIGNGNGHIYNNYFEGSDSGNGSGTSQIIGGDGSNIVSENCRFQSYENIYPYCISAGGGNDPYRDNGSYYAKTSSETPSQLSISVKVKSTWNPNKENYGYSLISAYNTKGTDIKDFCNSYVGAFKDSDKIKYITDSDMSKYISVKYPSPFLKSLSINEYTAAVMDTSIKYMFKNVGSGLYMEVDGAKAESGTNVQQWGADSEALHNTWKLRDAGDGYYYIRSCVGDGKTYFLDLSYGKSDNGTNIGIWTNDESDARKFKFADNGDGTYTILTKPSNDKSCIAVENDSTKSGANILQWECNGNDSQKWIAEKITIKDGAKIDTSKNYMIQNVNSGQFMEVSDGKAEAGTNVQQWGADTSKPSAHNVWRFKELDWGYYYIYSGTGDGNTFLLNCADAKDGTNIYIDSLLKSSTQYFKMVDNEDGTYTIVTRSSKDLSCVEIINASKDSGANVQQWKWNDNKCQKWKIIPVDYTMPFQKVTTATTKPVITTTTTTIVTTTTPYTSSSATTTTSSTQIPTIVVGDINENGKFEISDLIALQKYLIKIDKFNSKQYKIADINNDGSVNILDLIILKRKLLEN